MTDANMSTVITDNFQEDSKMEKSNKKINITTKEVVATGVGVGIGVVGYEVGKEIFPKLVEGVLEIVTKILGK